MQRHVPDYAPRPIQPPRRERLFTAFLAVTLTVGALVAVGWIAFGSVQPPPLLPAAPGGAPAPPAPAAQ